MDYEKIMQSIFDDYMTQECESAYGEYSEKAIDTIKTVCGEKEFCGIESAVMAGFAENERIGFYNGFKYAVALLTGGKAVA